MAIQDHFIHTIIHKPKAPTDEMGDPIGVATPDQQTANARVEWDTRTVMDRSGLERVALGVVFVGNDIALIEPEDLIEFEDHDYVVLTANRCETHVLWGGDMPREHWEIWFT